LVDTSQPNAIRDALVFFAQATLDNVAGWITTYDANGNLAGDGTNTYTWDARNHLNARSARDAHVADSFARLRCA
jgi:hypothetical protein